MKLTLILLLLFVFVLPSLAWARVIELRWNDNSTKETSFRIERRPAQNSTFTLLKIVGQNTTHTTDTVSTTTVQYCYRVQAQNASSRSAWSNVACTIKPPTAMSAK